MNERPKKATVRLSNGEVVDVYISSTEKNIYINANDCETSYKAEDLEFIKERN